MEEPDAGGLPAPDPVREEAAEQKLVGEDAQPEDPDQNLQDSEEEVDLLVGERVEDDEERVIDDLLREPLSAERPRSCR